MTDLTDERAAVLTTAKAEIVKAMQICSEKFELTPEENLILCAFIMGEVLAIQDMTTLHAKNLVNTYLLQGNQAAANLIRVPAGGRA